MQYDMRHAFTPPLVSLSALVLSDTCRSANMLPSLDAELGLSKKCMECTQTTIVPPCGLSATRTQLHMSAMHILQNAA